MDGGHLLGRLNERDRLSGGEGTRIEVSHIPLEGGNPNPTPGEMQLLFNLAQYFSLLMSPDNRICQVQKIVAMEILLSSISYHCNEGIQK